MVCSSSFGTNGSTVIFATGGLDWSSGLYGLITNVTVGGTRIITTKAITAEYFLELITKYKISFLVSNPIQMMKLSILPNFTKEAIQSLRFVLMAGAPASEELLKRIRSALTMGFLMFGYGGTEAGGISGNITNYKPKSVGKIFPNVQLKIVDPNTGERLGANQNGEICIKPGYKWLGYYKNPVATKTTLDSEGFIHSGDLGYMDDEHYLHLVDRCKDIMKFEGFHYSPHAIEEYIAEIPDVIDVCVFGVFDELRFDLPAAAVVLKEGSSLTENDIIKYVESRTDVPHKRIHYGVYFVNDLIRNRNGKFIRKDIKEMCLAMEKANKNNVKI